MASIPGRENGDAHIAILLEANGNVQEFVCQRSIDRKTMPQTRNLNVHTLMDDQKRVLPPQSSPVSCLYVRYALLSGVALAQGCGLVTAKTEACSYCMLSPYGIPVVV